MCRNVQQCTGQARIRKLHLNLKRYLCCWLCLLLDLDLLLGFDSLNEWKDYKYTEKYPEKTCRSMYAS